VGSLVCQSIFPGSPNALDYSTWLISGPGLHWQRRWHRVHMVANCLQLIGMPPMISGTVHEQLSPHVLGSISRRALGAMSFIGLFQSLPQVGAATPFLTSALPASLAILPEMAHGDDCSKRPKSEGSSHVTQSPPPRPMMMVAGSHWVPVTNR
jgi:hypothetical protein